MERGGTSWRNFSRPVIAASGTANMQSIASPRGLAWTAINRSATPWTARPRGRRPGVERMAPIPREPSLVPTTGGEADGPRAKILGGTAAARKGAGGGGTRGLAARKLDMLTASRRPRWTTAGSESWTMEKLTGSWKRTTEAPRPGSRLGGGFVFSVCVSEGDGS